MRHFVVVLFFVIASCTELTENIGCGTPSDRKQEEAKSMYNDLFSSRVYMSYEDMRKNFGCYAQRGDVVYSYSRIYDSGYVLVRDGQAVTYHTVESK